MTVNARDDDTLLGALVPDDVRELLRNRALVLPRRAHGRRHGRHASRRAGMGLDFRDHRPYVAGDEPRLLDWRAAARRDRLILRQTESEDDRDLLLILDASAAMGYGEGDAKKMRIATALAASLAWMAVRQGDRVGFAWGRDGNFSLDALRPGGRPRLAGLTRSLGELDPSGVCPWPELVRAAEPRLPRRGLLVLLSDFLDPAGHRGTEAGEVEHEWIRDLARVRARGHDVVLLQVLHRDELEFPWREGRMYRFEDLRGSRIAIEAPGSHLRRDYLERLRRHLEWLRSQCERTGLVLHSLVTDEPLGDGLVAFLTRLAGRAEGGQAAPPEVPRP